MDAIVYRTLFPSANHQRRESSTTTTPMSSYFFRLPSELKLEVVDYVSMLTLVG